MLPDFKRGVKATKREHLAFKQRGEEKIRQAQAEDKLREAAGELKDLESPETSAWANVPSVRFLRGYLGLSLLKRPRCQPWTPPTWMMRMGPWKSGAR